jgi:hypothetical protein
MNLKELLDRDFDMDLPISGGTGQSRDNPIIIHRRIPNDYTSVEYDILRCLGIGRGIEWKVLQQALLSHNGRSIDQLKIETIESRDDEIITQVENYYFDVTECL